jgi:uncharacterized glyoxalase superfamily protein PhnB
MIDPQTKPASQPIFTSAAAQVFVANMEAALAFYKGKLGFSVDFVYGDPGFYAQVRRDNALLTLRYVEEPVFTAAREREHLLSASITVASAEEIKALFMTFEAGEVPMHQRLRKEPWGALTFVARDPHGNLLLFAGPAD